MRLNPLRTPLRALAGGALCSVLACAGTFTITGLGDPKFDTEAAAINASGAAAVTAFADGPASIASGINSQGWVAGTTFGGNGAQATLFHDGQTWAVGGVGGGSFGRDVNNAGQVAGSANGRAYVAGNGQVSYLSHSLEARLDSANAINEAGAVAGTMVDEWGVSRGYLWYNGQTVWTGMLGGRNSAATNLNDAGHVVGFAETGDAWMHAYLTRDGLTIDLGTLGGSSSYAYGVNNRSDVVGYSWRADGAMAAFLWTNGIMLDLSSLVEGIDGWELATAFGINDAGQIVGTGFFQGRRSAFRLDPVAAGSVAEVMRPVETLAAETPEPSTGFLIVIGIGLIFISRRLGDTRKSE